MRTARDIIDLHHTFAGVPYPSRPLYWDARLPVITNMNTIDRWLAAYAEYLPNGCSFDEAAVMVPDANWRGALTMTLRQNGWQKFNEAADVVYTNPFGTRYTVEYTFFRHPEARWRLEVMLLGQPAGGGGAGFSPLHQALWPNGWAPQLSMDLWSEMPVPHLSFKVPEGMTYGQAVDHLRNKALLHAQTCQSTYGHFGYYLPHDNRRQLYVKPRVNLRDAGREG